MRRDSMSSSLVSSRSESPRSEAPRSEAAGAPLSHPLVLRAVAGERLALARLLTLIDDGEAGSGAHNDAAASAVAAHAAARADPALVVGITGVPGGGKSTLVNALLGVWLSRGHRVAVVAIDPSSPISGGAVLGDRVRMGEHGAHPNVFIRSFSSRGAVGGLSRTTRAAVDCFDAAGFDRIVVETVGAGQSETEIVSVADTRVVVCPPGLGDDVQALKAGILEIADVLAVSKGDLPLAEETARDLRDMLSLRRRPSDGEWETKIVRVSAITAAGIDDLLVAIEAHGRYAGHGLRLASRRNAPPQVDSATCEMPKSRDAWRARLAQMGAHDAFFSTVGLSVLEGGPGRAVIAMTVDARHINFNGGCHGGALFTLADTAFGMAANSHGSLASGIVTHMTFHSGVREGDRLIARAHEQRRSRHVGFYEVEVVSVGDDGKERPVAAFSGTVHIRSEPYRLHRADM